MKLSEAIRDGSSVTLPGYGQMLQLLESGRLKACALGTGAYWAMLKTGVNEDEIFSHPELNNGDPTELFESLFGVNINTGGLLTKPEEVSDKAWTTWVASMSPVGSILTSVLTLNDTLRWDRKRIADYLESQGY